MNSALQLNPDPNFYTVAVLKNIATQLQLPNRSKYTRKQELYDALSRFLTSPAQFQPAQIKPIQPIQPIQFQQTQPAVQHQPPQFQSQIPSFPPPIPSFPPPALPKKQQPTINPYLFNINLQGQSLQIPAQKLEVGGYNLSIPDQTIQIESQPLKGVLCRKPPAPIETPSINFTGQSLEETTGRVLEYCNSTVNDLYRLNPTQDQQLTLNQYVDFVNTQTKNITNDFIGGDQNRVRSSVNTLGNSCKNTYTALRSQIVNDKCY